MSDRTWYFSMLLAAVEAMSQVFLCSVSHVCPKFLTLLPKDFLFKRLLPRWGANSLLWVSLFMMQTLTGTEEDFSLLCICILCPALVATVKGTEVHLADIYRYYSPSCSSVIWLCFRASWHLFLPPSSIFLSQVERSAGPWWLWFLFLLWTFLLFYSSPSISQKYVFNQMWKV